MRWNGDPRLAAALILWAFFAAVFLSEMIFGEPSPLPWGAAGLLLLAAAGPVAALFARVDAPREEDAPQSLSARIARIEQALERLEARAAVRAPSPEPAPPPATAAAAPAQPDLPLDAAPVARPDWARIVRALDFPRSEDDAEGFAALEAALRDPETAKLLQAAEDVLTMLAANALHMEDYPPEPAALDDWRNYANGARGASVGAVAGIHDAAALDTVRARQASDGIFRDACLTLTRRWAGFMPRLMREAEIHAPGAADTRTGRAFMLVARAAGAFD